MGRLLLVQFVVLLALVDNCQPSPPRWSNYSSKNRRPNIIFILSDDLGFNDVSWNNPGGVVMPVLDNLARNGVILDQYYAQPLCTPSRAAYLSGYYPFRTGVQNTVVINGAAAYLPINLTLVPQKLKEVGYSTHLVGKWHLGHCRRDALPRHRGFDSHFGFYSGALTFFTKVVAADFLPANYPWDPAYDFRLNEDVYFSPPTEYLTDILNQRAVDLIRAHDTRSGPIFIALHHHAPHLPLEVPPEYLGAYPNVADPARRKYLAMVTAMDAGIGHVIQALRDRNMIDNTIVVFSSDNGGSIDLLGLDGGASNDPLRGQKGEMYEGGTRVPAFVYAPGFIRHPGRTDTGLFHVVDWGKTLLAAAGAESRGFGSDGVDQWDLIRSGGSSRRVGFIYQINGPNGALRLGRFKLIVGRGCDQACPMVKKRSADTLYEERPVDLDNFLLNLNDFAVQDRTKRYAAENMDWDLDLQTSPSELASSVPLERGKRRARTWVGPTPDKAIWLLRKIIEENEFDIEEQRSRVLVEDLLNVLCTTSLPYNRSPVCADCELYDLNEDPSETTDLAADRPYLLEALYNVYLLFKAQEVAPLYGLPPIIVSGANPALENNTIHSGWCENNVQQFRLIG